MGSTEAVNRLVKGYTSFRMQDGRLLCQRADGQTDQVKLDRWRPPAGLDPALYQRFLVLRTGFRAIERQMLERGIIDSDSMGTPKYDLPNRFDCRFVPTPLNAPIGALNALLKLPLRENRRFVDVGSGLGYPCLTAKLFGLDPTGIEADLSLAEAARRLSTLFDDLPQLRETGFLNQSFFDAKLGEFGYVYFYLWDDLFHAGKLAEKLADELRPGTVVMVYGNLSTPPAQVKI